MYSYEEALQASIDYFDGAELPAKVFLDKYALKNNEGELLEKTPYDMHKRIAKEFARIEESKYKGTDVEPLSEDLIFNKLNGFKYIVPQGSPMFGIGNDFQTISLSNCYLLDVPLDSYSSILQVDEQLVSISKRRGGVGIDLSNLRPKGAITHNAAKTSTGITTWMERYSNSIREVGQSGRRGALMCTLSVHHPDILDFCTIKNDNSKVTGANISVRLTKEFLDAVKSDSNYELRFPVDSKNVVQTIKAKDVWKTIIHSAWLRAEPGLLMWDNVVENTPADYYEEYKSRGTNPCQPGDALLLTKDGAKPLLEVNIGDEIWSSEGWTKIVDKQFTGLKPVYKFTTSGFCEFLNESAYFKGTLDHRVVSNGKKVKVSETTSIDFFNDDSPEGFTFDMLLMNAEIRDVEYLGSQEVYDITVDNESHTYWTGGCNVSNCSEINLSPLDSCRLLCLNLFSYVINPFTEKAKFDVTGFSEDCIVAQRLMDDLVDLESEKITKIIEKIDRDPEPKDVKSRERALWVKIKKFNDEGRRTGTGITGLGDALAALGIKYGSDKSVEVTEDIYRTLKLNCYKSSVEMAKALGPFKGYDYEKEKNCPFINRIKDEKPALYADMVKYGRRNISILTTAPTGTVSILTETTSGIEPLFMLGFTRRKKINPNDKNTRTDFIDQTGDHWQEFKVYHKRISDWMNISGETDITKSPWYGCCAEEIDWVNRVKMQAVAQKHVCHAISSTVNLPENVSEETVAEIYQTAFDSGCKGITVYRKNCRSGVLVDLEEKKEKINKTTAPKRPKKLKCDIHHTTIKGIRYYVVIGILEDDPYEVFIGRNMNSDGDSIISKSKTSGLITKKKQGEYELTCQDEHVANIVSHQCEEHEEAIARLTSASLRHGADTKFICETLLKTRGEMGGFSKAIARILKKYIKDGSTSEEKCPTCEDVSLSYQNGCVTCLNCGYSKCT